MLAEHHVALSPMTMPQGRLSPRATCAPGPLCWQVWCLLWQPLPSSHSDRSAHSTCPAAGRGGQPLTLCPGGPLPCAGCGFHCVPGWPPSGLSARCQPLCRTASGALAPCWALLSERQREVQFTTKSSLPGPARSPQALHFTVSAAAGPCLQRGV